MELPILVERFSHRFSREKKFFQLDFSANGNEPPIDVLRTHLSGGHWWVQHVNRWFFLIGWQKTKDSYFSRPSLSKQNYLLWLARLMSTVDHPFFYSGNDWWSRKSLPRPKDRICSSCYCFPCLHFYLHEFFWNQESSWLSPCVPWRPFYFFCLL